MSREIKFRAWDNAEKKWTLNIMEYVSSSRGDIWLEPALKSHEVVLEQYTGLKDKNGKEIYEGDILEIWIGGVKQIPPYIVTDLRELYLDFNRDDSYYCLSACRIIGNIHENPELLEEKKCNQ